MDFVSDDLTKFASAYEDQKASSDSDITPAAGTNNMNGGLFIQWDVNSKSCDGVQVMQPNMEVVTADNNNVDKTAVNYNQACDILGTWLYNASSQMYNETHVSALKAKVFQETLQSFRVTSYNCAEHYNKCENKNILQPTYDFMICVRGMIYSILVDAKRLSNLCDYNDVQCVAVMMSEHSESRERFDLVIEYMNIVMKKINDHLSVTHSVKGSKRGRRMA